MGATPQQFIFNLRYDSIGEKIIALHNQEFHRVRNIEETTAYQDGQHLFSSNLPRAHSYNQLLHRETLGCNVMTLKQALRYWDSIPERESVSADLATVIVFPQEGEKGNEGLRRKVLDVLHRSSPDNPLIISELGVQRERNEEGFTFIGTPFIDVVEAPYLVKNTALAYDLEKGVKEQEGGIPVMVPERQSGLRRVIRTSSGTIDARSVYLHLSSESSRIQVVQKPQYTIEEIEVKLAGQRDKSIEEAKRRIGQINEIYQDALEKIRALMPSK